MSKLFSPTIEFKWCVCKWIKCANLIDGQLIRIPLWDAFNAEIDNGHPNVRAFQCNHTARGPANISSANAANFRNDHSVWITLINFVALNLRKSKSNREFNAPTVSIICYTLLSPCQLAAFSQPIETTCKHKINRLLTYFT